MAEVSVSSNKGLGPSKVKNTNGTGGGEGSTAWYATEQSEPINVEDYTVHGYQVQVVDSSTLAPSAAAAGEKQRVLITSQNHGFALDETSLPDCLRVTHRSLFDESLQGMIHQSKPAFGFQGHPEAGPGPHDASCLFNQFVELMCNRELTL